ncbi:hypothetical protein PHYBOEH_010014 [Phytophthora boehmeriae]|uniref:Bzip transcription factor n=1 Tax=Phytophthora boehmeriae TaxID=109152 RepID=A0A8T1VPQ0_9STRA|nr:hypothetical protein PHYBOEH_010014 [Phytophthora boehmeriae]
MAVKDPNMTVDEWKKVRRREQCRMYQAEFWKRRRLLEERLTSEIEEINQNIEQLEKQKALFGPRQQRMKLVQTFYRSLQAGTWQQELLDVQNYRLTYGCTPALQTLSDLQREEFDSMESLKLHWLWYHSQFRQFDLSIATYECLVAGEHVIVEAIGSLRLGVECEDKIQVIVCPVLQQFEFEIGKAIVKRITSEVNLVNFVCGEEQPSPERILNTLSYLSQGFCSSN